MRESASNGFKPGGEKGARPPDRPDQGRHERQGAAADTAVQLGDLAPVATSGAYADLTGAPSIPAAPGDIGAATAAQGALAESAVEGEGILKAQAITQAAYTALDPKSATTLYVITD